MRRFMPSPAFLALLALACLVRLPLLSFPGFFGDLQIFVSWGQITDTHFWHFYSVAGGARTIANYPPLASYLFGTQIWLWVHGRLLLGHQSGLSGSPSPSLATWMKLPMLAADLLTIALLYQEARQALSERKALLVTACYALNPAILVMAAMWGQLEPIFLLFLLLGFWSTLRGHPRRVGMYLALACLIKPQPVIFLPLLLVWLFRHVGWRKACEASIAFIIVTVGGWLPYLLPLPPRPEVLAFLHNSLAWELGHPASAAASNLWWLLNRNYPGKAPLVGPLSPDMLGALFFAPVLILALVGIWRNRSVGQFFLSVLLIQVSSFDMLALQHSRFLYAALALALLAALADRRLWLAFGSLWVSLSLNLISNTLIPSDAYRVQIIAPALAQWSLTNQPMLHVWADIAAWINLIVLAGLVSLQMAPFRRRPVSQQEQPVSMAPKSEGILIHPN